MKIALVGSHGGHLTELLSLKAAFEGHDTFFVTYKSPRAGRLGRVYALSNIGLNPLRGLAAFAKILRIWLREKPRLVVSTGSEIAIPALYAAKILGIRTLFIESLCRVEDLSRTARYVSPASDVLLVQWPGIAKRHPKARYWGGLL